MRTFEVWAPRGNRVEIDLDGHRVPLRPQPRGYWRGEADVAAGTDYRFVLDRGEPLPDPRSPWQPQGVHGPSRVVDHEQFRWTDQGWRAGPLAAALIYELHVGTFTPEGTFDGVIDRLDHLGRLGVSHLELMPIAEFPGRRGWGYDGVDLFAPHHAYGGPESLKRLVDACHARGIGVLLDVVYNHLGPSGNYLGHYGPYFTDRYVTPWGEAINLDGRGSDEVRRFLCDNALMWLRDYHFDGLRIDAVHAIVDTSAVHFLEQLAGEVKALEAQLGRHLVVIAESDLNDPRVVRPVELGGYGLDAQWSEDFHHALHAALTGERHGYYADFGRLADLAKALAHILVYDGRYSRYRDRRHGRPATGLSGDRFVGCLQNHDQVGNRARGERSAHLVSLGLQKVAAALVLTAPFVPMLFQGEEWGASAPFHYFTDHTEPELAQAVRVGRRTEFAAFGWDPALIPDPQAPATFAQCRLDWSEREREPHAQLLDWHQRLVRLRRGQPALTDGRMDGVRVGYDETAHWLVLERGPIRVICNFAEHSREVPLPGADRGQVLLSSAAGMRLSADRVELPAESVIILEQDPAGRATDPGS